MSRTLKFRTVSSMVKDALRHVPKGTEFKPRQIVDLMPRLSATAIYAAVDKMVASGAVRKVGGTMRTPILRVVNMDNWKPVVLSHRASGPREDVPYAPTLLPVQEKLPLPEPTKSEAVRRAAQEHGIPVIDTPLAEQETPRVDGVCWDDNEAFERELDRRREEAKRDPSVMFSVEFSKWTHRNMARIFAVDAKRQSGIHAQTPNPKRARPVKSNAPTLRDLAQAVREAMALLREVSNDLMGRELGRPGLSSVSTSELIAELSRRTR